MAADPTDSFPTAQLEACLQLARVRAGLSLRELAARAGTSHATLIAYERGRKSPTLRTFQRILEACNQAADVTLRPRIRERAGLPRGEELVQVLRLAEQFPSSPKRSLDAPNFARLMGASND